MIIAGVKVAFAQDDLIRIRCYQYQEQSLYKSSNIFIHLGSILEGWIYILSSPKMDLCSYYTSLDKIYAIFIQQKA